MSDLEKSISIDKAGVSEKLQAVQESGSSSAEGEEINASGHVRISARLSLFPFSCAEIWTLNSG